MLMWWSANWLLPCLYKDNYNHLPLTNPSKALKDKFSEKKISTIIFKLFDTGINKIW